MPQKEQPQGSARLPLGFRTRVKPLVMLKVGCQPSGKEENDFLFLSEGSRDKEKGTVVQCEYGSSVAEKRHGTVVYRGPPYLRHRTGGPM